jgi:hypothetical protein
MRFMILVKATKESEAGVMPDEQVLAPMMKYNEELAKAGVLLDLSGLKPTKDGVRIKFNRGKTTVIDGPFTETKELVAGYWLIQVKSKAEAIEWAKRAPMTASPKWPEAEIEIRPLFDVDDFNPSEALVEQAREIEKHLPDTGKAAWKRMLPTEK